MTIILLELHGTNSTVGNVEDHEVDDDYFDTHDYDSIGDHPLFDTPLVADLVENHEDENEALIIPLPPFIDDDSFTMFCNHLLRYKLGSERVGFGKYEQLTYDAMWLHSDYIEWARNQDNPSPGMANLLSWIDSKGTVQATWRNSSQNIIRIARFFLVNLCSRCGVMREVQYYPCYRAQWPNIPTIPVYEDAVRGLDEDDHERRLNAWRESWDAAERDARTNGRPFCTNDDLRCYDCMCASACCLVCKSWECSQCFERRDTEQDNEDLLVMKRWYQGDPRAYSDAYMLQRMGEVIDDEDGRRGEPPQQLLRLQRCMGCRRRTCNPCGKECIECHRRSCNNCPRTEYLNRLCEECMDLFKNENEVDRSDMAISRRIAGNECICRTCYDRQPHTCPCGEPSYDPNAESEDSEAEFDEAEFDDDASDNDEDIGGMWRQIHEEYYGM